MQLVSSADRTVIKHITVKKFGKPMNILVEVRGTPEANVAELMVP